jgi:hypothetical protein
MIGVSVPLCAAGDSVLYVMVASASCAMLLLLAMWAALLVDVLHSLCHSVLRCAASC